MNRNIHTFQAAATAGHSSSLPSITRKFTSYQEVDNTMILGQCLPTITPNAPNCTDMLYGLLSNQDSDSCRPKRIHSPLNPTRANRLGLPTELQFNINDIPRIPVSKKNDDEESSTTTTTQERKRSLIECLLQSQPLDRDWATSRIEPRPPLALPLLQQEDELSLSSHSSSSSSSWEEEQRRSSSAATTRTADTAESFDLEQYPYLMDFLRASKRRRTRK